VSADETLAEPNNIRARQAAGTVHVHPNGRFVYGANLRRRRQVGVGSNLARMPVSVAL